VVKKPTAAKPKRAAATAVKTAVKTAAKKAPVKPAVRPVAKQAATPPVNLKGLKISGNKAARIAQIVAESFLNKPATAETAPASSAAPLNAASDDSGLTAAHKAAAVLFSKKAEDVVLMDLRNLSTVADYYLIATCTNEPQMRSILTTVQRSLSREGIKSLRSEYMSGVRWAVVDYGDMILHLFEKQTRGFYSLERLWADAPSTHLKASDYALPASDDSEESDDDGDL
jgi:ribosome-associated protein